MNSHRTPEQSAALARVLGDASTVARQQRNLTRDERFAALREAGHGYAAPEYKIGDRVTFEGRASIVEDYNARGGIVTVSNYAGRFMVGRTHPELEAAEA